MGFIKDLGKVAGSVAGLVVGAPIAVVGEVVNSEFLQEVGVGVFKVTERTGELLGNVAEGTAKIVEEEKKLLEMVARSLNEEKSDRLVGVDDVKKKFKNAMDEYLERMQDVL